MGFFHVISVSLCLSYDPEAVSAGFVMRCDWEMSSRGISLVMRLVSQLVTHCCHLVKQMWPRTCYDSTVWLRSCDILIFFKAVLFQWTEVLVVSCIEWMDGCLKIHLPKYSTLLSLVLCNQLFENVNLHRGNSPVMICCVVLLWPLRGTTGRAAGHN